MANRLSMATIHSVETRHRSGHSRREIARLLGIDRGTVNDDVRRLQAAWGDEGAGPRKPNPHTGADQNRPNPQPGAEQNRPNPHTGSSEDNSQNQRQITYPPQPLADFNPQNGGRF